MRKSLEGKRVVIGGSRKLEEISSLIEKQGGIPVVRSLQGTIILDETEVEPNLMKFIREGADWVVFTTGLGLDTLLNLAAKLNVKDEFLNIIQKAKVSSRGYKTLAALKKWGIAPDAVDEDGTTKGLTRSLHGFDFTGKNVMLQLHGEEAPALTKFFENEGASVLKILPYRHIAPEAETVKTLIQEIINSEVDAVCFTTAIQVHSLFTFAKMEETYTNILQAFSNNVVAAAVGKVTAEALREEGIERFISPDMERMGAMIIELSRFYQTTITE